MRKPHIKKAIIKRPRKRFSETRFGLWLNKLFRRTYKSLLRNPYQVVLILVAVACMIFTFDLYVHSKVVSRMSSPMMGFWTFVITLFAFLSVVTYLFYMDKKSIIMLIIFELMTVAEMAIGTFYLLTIQSELDKGLMPMDANIAKSWNDVTWAIIFWGISFAFSFLVIVFDRYMKKRKRIKDEQRR